MHALRLCAARRCGSQWRALVNLECARTDEEGVNHRPVRAPHLSIPRAVGRCVSDRTSIASLPRTAGISTPSGIARRSWVNVTLPSPFVPAPPPPCPRSPRPASDERSCHGGPAAEGAQPAQTPAAATPTPNARRTARRRSVGRGWRSVSVGAGAARGSTQPQGLRPPAVYRFTGRERAHRGARHRCGA